MKEDKRDIWFPAKTYGWGWGFPITWQGWVVTIVFLIVFLTGNIYFELQKNSINQVVFGVTCITIVGVICWWKGEEPRWRWGEDDRQKLDYIIFQNIQCD